MQLVELLVPALLGIVSVHAVLGAHSGIHRHVVKAPDLTPRTQSLLGGMYLSLFFFSSLIPVSSSIPGTGASAKLRKHLTVKRY